MPTPDEIETLVRAWLDVGSWGESRTFLTDHAGDLLSDEAAATLQRLAAEHPEQEVLTLHEELLEAARVGGIEAAFDAIDESVRRFALAERLVAWATTESWDKARQFYDDEAVVLGTDEAESVLEELVDDNPGQSDLLAHQGLLTLIRLDGADAAFGLLEDPENLGDVVISAANREDRDRGIPRARLLAGLFPDNLGAQLALATTALSLGERNEAARAVARCAEWLPADQRALMSEALANLARSQPELADGLTMLHDLLPS
ncbi:MAG TPA: hypothetical protein VHT30_10960 [Acidimicrobiales bacterium]|jgi:tetratricopeptide (TPR) repeat protein|nr:hypothetical protein [Acidimicrobiales bacterium]